MAINILKGERSRGYDIVSGITVLGGMGVYKSSTDTTGETLTLSAGGTTVFGLAVESNVQYSTIGYKFDDYDRGDKVSTTLGPGLVEIWNDGRGAPYDDSKTYTLGQPLYIDANGRVSNSAINSSAPRIGYVDKPPTTVGDTLRIRLIDC